MRYALIIVFGVCYYAGWLPASFVVPALLVISALRLPERSPSGRNRRRGGYIAPASSASGGASPGTVQRVQTYTDSFRQPGPHSEVRTAFTTRVGQNKTSEPGSYMSEWGFSPGRLTTDAEPLAPTWDNVAKVATQKLDDAGLLGFFMAATDPPPGDCGCGDTAA